MYNIVNYIPSNMKRIYPAGGNAIFVKTVKSHNRFEEALKLFAETLEVN